MELLFGYEPYTLRSWIDRGMSVQVENAFAQSKTTVKRAKRAAGLVNRWVMASVLTAASSLSTFAWAGDTQVPFSSINPHNVVQPSEDVPRGYYEKLMLRLRSARSIPADADIVDPDPFY